MGGWALKFSVPRLVAIGLAAAAIGSLFFMPADVDARGHVHGSGWEYFPNVGPAPVGGCAMSQAPAHDDGAEQGSPETTG